MKLSSIKKIVCCTGVYIVFFPSFTKVSLIPALPAVALRVGVTGRELLNDGVFGFLSEGFKI